MSTSHIVFEKLPHIEALNYSDFKPFSGTVMVTSFVQAKKSKFPPNKRTHASAISHNGDNVYDVQFISLMPRKNNKAFFFQTIPSESPFFTLKISAINANIG